MQELNFQSKELQKKNALRSEWGERTQIYESVAQIVPGIFFIINNRYRYIEWSKNMETEFGYSNKEIVETPIYKLPQEGNQYNLKLKIDEVFDEGYGQFDYELMMKNGEKKEYHIQVKRLKYRGEYCIIGSKVNISPLKQAEIMLINAHRSIKILRKKLESTLIGESTIEKNYVNFSDPESTRLFKQNLVAYFEELEPYLNPYLKLEEVAKKMNTEPRQISQFLHQEFQSGFNNYINQFRIEKFKKLIDSGLTSRFSIEGLMKKVGFNSKAPFYRAFKEKEGILPLEYIKKRN